jgi:SARP family transcriptional regulator, regulator of embCAB operon
MANGADDAGPLRLTLLGGFNLLRGDEQVVLPATAQRLVALIALRDRPLSRIYLAGVLWPDCPAERSLADLRTALWRANHSRAPVVTMVGMRLSLRADVQVDVRALVAFGRAAAERTATSAAAELAGVSWPELALDLLPDWYDDWLADDRERLRQLRLHALESMTDELSLRGRHVAAIQAALAAVTLDPLRETAHAALIKAHLAEGNRSEALRQFRRCRDLLAAGLAVEPSESIRQLIADPAIFSGQVMAS